MSWIVVAWSMMMAVAMTLGMLHLTIWIRQRRNYAHLWFCLVAFSASAMAGLEVQMMKADTAEVFFAALRWSQLAAFTLVVSLACLVHVYFETGRVWLAAVAC